MLYYEKAVIDGIVRFGVATAGMPAGSGGG